MTTEKSQNQIEDYLNSLDDSKNYPADFASFISEINKRIFIPIRIERENGDVSAEDYSLSYLLGLPGEGDIGFAFGDNLIPYREDLLNPSDLEAYFNALEGYLAQEIKPTESTLGTPGTSQQNITYNALADNSVAQTIYTDILDWNTTSTDTATYNFDNPKVMGVVAQPAKTQDQETGEFFFRSKDYYVGPNTAINELDEYVDVTTGETKKFNGEPLKPIFRIGAASALFEGLSQEKIFEIQQDLAAVGLDLGSFAFEAGNVNTTIRGAEVDFVALLMTEANELNSLFPELNLIDKSAGTLYGQLKPYIEYKKQNIEETNLFVDKLGKEFAGEIVPPNEAQIKSAVDKAFVDAGINPTAADYATYGAVFTNLQSQAASRQAEIDRNKLTLADVIGLGTTYDSTTEIGPYTYGGFGVSLPSSEEARQELGKPLLPTIDVEFELNKIVEEREAGRIDAAKEIIARTAQAAAFKKNFMVFEENF